VVSDQLGLDALGEQRPGARVPGAPRGPGAEAIELQAADVADARRELQGGQIEDRECGEGLPGGVGGVLGDRQVGRVPKISSSTATASRQVVGMTLMPYVEC